MDFWVLGGDRRQQALAELLSADGHRVTCFALGGGRDSLDLIGQADCVVLPMPVSREPGLLFAPGAEGPVPLEPIFSGLSRRSFLCGGRVSPTVKRMAAGENLIIEDYFEREELAVANAVPTAEGAVRMAMELMPVTVHRSRVLILGFGRVGQAAALRFRALGAEVTAAARRPEVLALAEGLGCQAQRLGAVSGAERFDLVVNTAPAPVAGRAFLAQLRRGCPVIDLASDPGGVDLAAAEELGLRALRAPALPGKEAPKTAGAAIRDTIYHMLEEREVSFGE